MSSSHSAAPQALGYLYQIKYALFLALDLDIGSKIAIENLDDVVFQESGSPQELIQLKHHATPGNLSDFSPDLWKTVAIWIDLYKDNKIDLKTDSLTLVTTEPSIKDSALFYLRAENDSRNENAALQKLESAANTSNNQALKTAFGKFLGLSNTEKVQLISRIKLIDNFPDIININFKIADKLKTSCRPEHYTHLTDRLEGWWFKRVILHLSDSNQEMIDSLEVLTVIGDIRDQFKPDALPIDFLVEEPPNPPDPQKDQRIFVLQLKSIELNSKLIELAIKDYYRAYEQRSRWLREDLIINDDVQKYETVLIEEWERFQATVKNEYRDHEKSEEILIEIGKKIFNWVNFTADFRIRSEVREKYVMRGSYHILANATPPHIWWHPEFIERLEGILLNA